MNRSHGMAVVSIFYYKSTMKISVLTMTENKLTKVISSNLFQNVFILIKWSYVSSLLKIFYDKKHGYSKNSGLGNYSFIFLLDARKLKNNYLWSSSILCLARNWDTSLLVGPSDFPSFPAYELIFEFIRLVDVFCPEFGIKGLYVLNVAMMKRAW